MGDMTTGEENSLSFQINTLYAHWTSKMTTHFEKLHTYPNVLTISKIILECFQEKKKKIYIYIYLTKK